MKIAIITARGGSKRIPRKNIKNFCGKPIIKYSIDAAITSRAFDTVMVSTDDIEIANISIECGAEVPFYRSNATSNDYAVTSEVIREVLSEYSNNGVSYDRFCCLYPTAPFIQPKILLSAMSLLNDDNIDVVLPVVCFSFPPQRGSVIKNNRLEMLFPEFLNTRSQDIEPMYHDAGLFYCAKTDAFLRDGILYMERNKPFIMPAEQVQDIDTIEDWNLAEIKYKVLMERQNEALR